MKDWPTRAWAIAHWVECLPNMHRTLASTSSSKNKTKNWSVGQAICLMEVKTFLNVPYLFWFAWLESLIWL